MVTNHNYNYENPWRLTESDDSGRVGPATMDIRGSPDPQRIEHPKPRDFSMRTSPLAPGTLWELLGHSENFWVLLEASRRLWGAPEAPWQLLGDSGNPWELVGDSGSTWAPQAASGSHWAAQGASGILGPLPP